LGELAAPIPEPAPPQHASLSRTRSVTNATPREPRQARQMLW
jgi:hypothetical protein